MSRPEHTSAPELFYNEQEAKKYSQSSRMLSIQREITLRALELLNLKETGKLIMDIGCGSGLSGQVIQEEGECCFLNDKQGLIYIYVKVIIGLV